MCVLLHRPTRCRHSEDMLACAFGTAPVQTPVCTRLHYCSTLVQMTLQIRSRRLAEKDANMIYIHIEVNVSDCFYFIYLNGFLAELEARHDWNVTSSVAFP